MKHFPSIAICTLSFAVLAAAQDGSSRGSSSTQNPTVSGAGQTHQQENAKSATQDTSAISGDQVSKPAGTKEASVVGCLGNPDADGRLVLHSMQFRSGVEVSGPSNLKDAAGQKVKLSGQWIAVNEAQPDAGQKRQRRFQATSFDVLGEKCPPPAETTPVSKKKQKQQKAAAKAAASNDNPK
jgi:hypothetical protein